MLQTQSIQQIEYFRRAMERVPAYSPSWYHFHRNQAMWIAKWRETNTLRSVPL